MIAYAPVRNNQKYENNESTWAGKVSVIINKSRFAYNNGS